MKQRQIIDYIILIPISITVLYGAFFNHSDDMASIVLVLGSFTVGMFLERLRTPKSFQKNTC